MRLIVPLRFIVVRLVVVATVLLGLVVVMTPSSSSPSGITLKYSSRPSTNTSEGQGRPVLLGYDHPVDFSPLLSDLRAGHRKFDWKDWLDLSKTELYENNDLDPKLYPLLSRTRKMSNIQMPAGTSTQQEQAMVGRLYCKYYLPAPMRVITLLGSGRPLSEQGYEEFLVHHPKGRNHRQFGHKSDSQYQSLSPRPLVKDLSRDQDPLRRLQPEIHPDLFKWEPADDGYVSIGETDADEGWYGDSDLSRTRQAHAITVSAALKEVKHSPKHFHEVHLLKDPLGHGSHYDWRFFRGIADHYAHREAIHHLSRAWNQFADMFGLTYWYAHGSLLGWWWDGMTMPWDMDNDIQMPIIELDRLAREFNHTMVVLQEEGSDTSHAYLIDVNPWYVERVKGNGNNVIDARFIDVATGAYIDISALAHTRGRSKVNCKNWHSYSIAELVPPRRTLFEGTPAYVPREFPKLLRNEYRYYDRDSFQKWRFNHAVQLWELEQTCESYLSQYKNNPLVYCVPRDVMDLETCQSSGIRENYDTCDRVTLTEYKRTRPLTQAHLQMMHLWDDTAGVLEDKALEVISILSAYHPPLVQSVSHDEFDLPSLDSEPPLVQL